MRWTITIILLAAIVLAMAATIVVIARRYASPPITGTIAIEATSSTKPSANAATSPVARSNPSASPRVQTYSDLLHVLPGMADATIAEDKVPISQAAAIRISFPCYICPRHDLWIAHPDAAPLASLDQEQLIKQTIHLTREQVVYVHWRRVARQLQVTPVIRDDAGAYRLLVAKAPPVKLERFDYHWARAINMDDSIVVPSDQGVTVIRINGKEVTQQYRQITDQQQASPQIAATGKGFIAWVPAAWGIGPGQVLRYTDGAWVDDFARQELWAGPFIHLVPFTDGNILQILPDGPGRVQTNIVPLESRPADEAQVRKLMAQLSDDDGAIRADAHAKLAGMGPSAWAIIKQAMPNLPLEAQARASQIVSASTQPKLGRFEVISNSLRPIWRLQDGGVILLADQGVMATQDDPNEVPTVPAWICIRPGTTISLLPPTLTRYLAIGTSDLQAIGPDWVITDDKEGARIFFGQELQPLTREADRRYREVLGVDNDGRILLAPTDLKRFQHDYLLIDPKVADPTPVLPVWTMTVPEGEAGWDAQDWPAIKRGQPWALHDDGWEALTGDLQKTPPPANTITQIQQTLTQVGQDPAGTTFWSNQKVLALCTPDGRWTMQPRPSGLPTTDLGGVYTRDRLYLLHPQGKLSRLKVDPRNPEPFTTDAIFKNDIPFVAQASRMWLDPAGRICIAADEDRIIIIFVTRKIPQAIQDIIPADELKQARP